MPWTLEKPEKSGEFWLEVQTTEFFLLEQKIKDVSTPRGGRNRSKTVGNFRRSGSQSSLPSSDPKFLKETARFNFTPKAHPDSLILFRIRSHENVTREGTPLVIAVGFTLESILETWEIVQTEIISNIKRAGLHQSNRVNYTPVRFYEFLLFQICSLANSQVEEIQYPKRFSLDRSKSKQIQHLHVTKPKRRASFGIDQIIPTINEVRRSTRVPLRLSDPFVQRPAISYKEIQALTSATLTLPPRFDLEEPVLHALNCVLVTVKQKTTTTNVFCSERKFYPGILVLTASSFGFYLRPPSDRQDQLRFRFSEIERIAHNPEIEDGELPPSLSVFHNSRKQFLFIGVTDNTVLARKLHELWEAYLTKQQKKLNQRLKKQTFVYQSKKESSSLPNIKILSFFAKKKHNVAIVPTTTKLPIFSLAPFVLESAESEKCCIMIENHLEFPVAGKFHLTSTGGTFVSRKNSLMFTMNYVCVKSINYTECLGSDIPNVEVKFMNFRFVVTLKGLSQDLSNRWIKEWFLKREQFDAVDSLHYSEFSDEHESPELIELKQRYMSNVIPETKPNLLACWNEYYSAHAEASLRTDTLQRLIYLGIPNEIRGSWWCSLVGVEEKKLAKDEVPYGYMISYFASLESVATFEIQRDIHRSLPEHDYYHPENQGCDVLESVLTAYSWRNSAIGYCQSMNLICGLLLLYMSEEDAYALLCVICEDLLPNYYTPTMDGSLTDQQVLLSLIEEYLPDIHKHLTHLNAPIAVITLPWFLCLFIQTIPWEASVRVLDLFFAFGRKVLFQLALGIFKLHNDLILGCSDSIEVIFTIKESLEKLNADELVQAAIEFDYISLKHIDELWSKHHPEILNEIEHAKQESAPTPPATPPSTPPRTSTSAPEPVSILAPKKPRPIPRMTRKKSFQLVQTNDELRDLVKNNSNNRLVSIIETFKERSDNETL